MELRVNDYVRIKNEAGWCCIGKIVNINEFREPDMKYCIDIQGEDYIFVPEDMIAKSSPNIIDIIEYGDIVKYKIDDEQFISEIWGEKNNYFVQNFDVPIDLRDLNVVSIVTHEQFSQMEYKVGD